MSGGEACVDGCTAHEGRCEKPTKGKPNPPKLTFEAWPPLPSIYTPEVALERGHRPSTRGGRSAVRAPFRVGGGAVRRTFGGLTVHDSLIAT